MIFALQLVILQVYPILCLHKTAALIFSRGGGFVMQGFSDILPRSDTECPQPLGFPRDRGQASR